MSRQIFESVWDAIEDTPEQAAEMKRRSSLMISLNNYILQNGLDDTSAAATLEVSKRKISQLKRGQIDLLSLEILSKMAEAAGLPSDSTSRPPVSAFK